MANSITEYVIAGATVLISIVTIVLTTKMKRLSMRRDAALKLTEYRHQWINELRQSMAEFQSMGIAPELTPASTREFYQLGTKIELMMNPNDPDFPELQDALYGFLEASNGNIDEKYSANAPYVAVCQKILKREWEVLKDDLKFQLGVEKKWLRKPLKNTIQS